MTEEAKGQIYVKDESDDITIKSISTIIITPTTATLTISTDGDSGSLKFKQKIKAEGVALNYIDYNARIEGSYDTGEITCWMLLERLISEKWR